LDPLKQIIPPVHREGWRFVAIFAIVTVLLFLVWDVLGWLGVLATLWCAWFFRDPDRVTPVREGLIVSPADGVVQAIGPAVPPPELELGDAPRLRISIFLNLLDVHINRVPADGLVLRRVYRPGLFLNAALDKASEQNERSAVVMKMTGGQELVFVQIAGLVARRILCELSAGDAVQAGERFGLIRFGSRADIYLPDGVSPLVAEGQRMIGGETVLADVHAGEAPRLGAVR
jgi:phosphatidylserine decarboxylase